MINIFNLEEESRFFGIINDYQTIYEKASFLSIEMTKMEEEMKELLDRMEGLKTEETTMYETISKRTSLDLTEVKQKASELVLAKVQNENKE
jgi:hypothetical protein